MTFRTIPSDASAYIEAACRDLMVPCAAVEAELNLRPQEPMRGVHIMASTVSWLKAYGYWLAVGMEVVATVILMVVAATLYPPNWFSFSGQFHFVLTAAATVAVIAGGSVVIERLLEGFWIVMDMTKGSDWPLGPKAKKLNDRLTTVKTALEGVLEKATGSLIPPETATDDEKKQFYAKLDTATKEAVDDFESVKNEMALLVGASDSKWVSQHFGELNKAVDEFVKNHPGLTEPAQVITWRNTAAEVAADFQTFFATFDDNPSRRLVSIFGGSIVGLLVAFFFGLNAFASVTVTCSAGTPTATATATSTTGALGENPSASGTPIPTAGPPPCSPGATSTATPVATNPAGISTAGVQPLTTTTASPSPGTGQPAAPAAPSLWIAITGLVMGLGSVPTHELIKAIQQFKQAQG